MLSCGDLPFDYLEYLVSRLDVPLLYVPGNHDPGLKPPDSTWIPMQFEPASLGPPGCENIDGRVVDVGGLRVAGLGGSIRYREGANQYTQRQMRWRAVAIELRVRLKRVRGGSKLDVIVTHAPPAGLLEHQDAAHAGFAAFHRLLRELRPVLLVHGHVHPFGRGRPERLVGSTRVVNAVPSLMIEI